ncbi:hypothetical protein EYV94_11975 [Puteibacter caeruleilacunae]|nr:hypothetical protein EYV94_11975 [Puteibacter caeruleilacunae]
MKTEDQYLQDLKEIRTMMERSSRFLSLSGWSGVFAGLYAIIGAIIAYYIVYIPGTFFEYRRVYVNDQIKELVVIAFAVLLLSIVTGYWATYIKAKRRGEKVWGAGSKQMLVNIAIPLVTGGIFCLVMLMRGYYGIVAPAMLIFYGLALVNGSKYTLNELFYLGIFEILLGLVVAFLPGYGLIFWTMGFGILHIIYGLLMYIRHDK